MKNKGIKIGLIIIVIIIIISIVYFIKFRTYKSDVNYEVIGGYIDCPSKILFNYQEYLEYINNFNIKYKYGDINVFNYEKYNEKYFDEKSLAIINIITGSSANKLKSINFKIENNELICNVKIKQNSGPALTVMDGQVYLVEIDKFITNFKINE